MAEANGEHLPMGRLAPLKDTGTIVMSGKGQPDSSARMNRSLGHSELRQLATKAVDQGRELRVGQVVDARELCPSNNLLIDAASPSYLPFSST